MARVCGTPLGLRAVLLGEVARALDELLRRARVAHVDERDAADAVGRARAPLVLVDEQVALEGGRVHRDDLRALAGERVRVARDVALHLRLRRVGDVDDLHAAAAAGRLVEHRQVGVVALGRDVGHAAGAGELAAEVGLADQLEAVLSGRHRLLRPAHGARGAVRVPVHADAGVDPAVARGPEVASGARRRCRRRLRVRPSRPAPRGRRNVASRVPFSSSRAALHRATHPHVTPGRPASRLRRIAAD